MSILKGVHTGNSAHMYICAVLVLKHPHVREARMSSARLPLVAPVSTAMSCRLALRFSPKPGALTATTFTPARSLFTIRVARACTDTHQPSAVGSTPAQPDTTICCAAQEITLLCIGTPPVLHAAPQPQTTRQCHKVTQHSVPPPPMLRGTAAPPPPKAEPHRPHPPRSPRPLR